MPLEGQRVAGVDGERCRAERLIDRLHLEPGALQRRADEIADVAPLVLDADDDLEHHRPALERPDSLIERRPGRFHLLLDERVGELRIVADTGAANRLEDGQLVIIQRADVADHGHGTTAVDIAGDEVPVDEVLHGLPNLADGERVQLSLARGGGVEDQGKGGRRRLDDAHTLGAGELLGPGGLETVEVEVHLVLGDLDRRLIDVERGENQPVGGGSGTAGFLRRGTGNSGAAADVSDGGRQPQAGGALHEATARDTARRGIGIREIVSSSWLDLRRRGRGAAGSPHGTSFVPATGVAAPTRGRRHRISSSSRAIESNPNSVKKEAVATLPVSS